MNFRNKVAIAIALGLLLLGSVSGLSYWNALREEKDRQLVIRTYQVLESIDGLSLDLADVDGGQRAYALTADPAYLPPFNAEINRIPSTLAQLRQLTADNPNQQHNLDVLEPLVREKIAQMRTAVEMRKNSQMDARQELAFREADRNRAVKIHEQLTAMADEEQRLLQQRTIRAAAAFRNTKAAMLLRNVLAICLLLGAGLVIRREFGQRQKAETALRTNEERFRLMVSNVATYAILTLDPDGLVVTWNAGAQRIKGYREEEIVGQHFSRFYLAEDVAAGKPEMELQIAAAEGRIEDEGWRIRKDGSRFWANVVITAMRDTKGELIGFSKVTRDLTERKRAEEEVRNLNRSLEQRVTELTIANRELDAFTYSLAHDLRAPLRHMHGFAELLWRSSHQNLNDEEKSFLTTILNSSREMGRLIDELLNFARLGRTDLKQARVDLREVVEDVRRQLESETKGRAVRWQVGDLPVVCGDPTMLRQVFVNLLSNAVKYTGKTPAAHIEIGSDNGAGKITVFVRDNGAGFDMQYAGKLFEVFQRLHGHDDFEGVGVGLANVRRIIERHGGRVWAEGAPGRGATFYFSLPQKEG
jgi:PAS domain S-box-containing protein